jgi:hypothetical protein
MVRSGNVPGAEGIGGMVGEGCDGRGIFPPGPRLGPRPGLRLRRLGWEDQSKNKKTKNTKSRNTKRRVGGKREKDQQSGDDLSGTPGATPC